MTARRRLALACLFAVFAMAVVACGDDDDGETDDTASTTTTADSETDDTATATTTTTADNETDDTATATTTTTAAESSDDGETAAGGSGTPAPQPLDERVSVTISIPGLYEPFLPFMLAAEMGEFEKENVEVVVETVPTTDSLILLATGDTDGAMTGLSAAFYNAIASDVIVRWTAGSFLPNPADDGGLYVRSEIVEGDPADFDFGALEGRTIALSRGIGGNEAYPLASALATADLTLNDVNIIQMSNSDATVALIAGSVDAAYGVAPQTTQWVADGHVRVIESPPGSFGGMFFGERLLTDDHEAGVAIVRAMQRTVRTYLDGDYKADPEFVAVISDLLDIDEETLTGTPSLSFDPDLAVWPENAVGLQDAWLSVGDVLDYDEPLPVDSIVDTSFVEQALGG